MTPRQRLCHKLRDGAYRARLAGCHVELVRIADALDLLAETHCYYCGVLLDGIYSLEHKMPLAHKGSHELANICKSCVKCNEAKHTMTEDEFVAWLAGSYDSAA
jgi:5-methylcytosine-specific restriction endonuclease McrA